MIDVKHAMISVRFDTISTELFGNYDTMKNIRVLCEPKENNNDLIEIIITHHHEQAAIVIEPAISRIGNGEVSIYPNFKNITIEQILDMAVASGLIKNY